MSGVKADLVDTLGSVATTITLPAGPAPVQVGTVGTYDEYGNTLTSGPGTGAGTSYWTSNAQNRYLRGSR